MKSISHVCETRKLVMAILHWKQGLLCDKKRVNASPWSMTSHNIVMARNEQFLLFPQCFQNLSVVDASKFSIYGVKVKRAVGELNNIF